MNPLLRRLEAAVRHRTMASACVLFLIITWPLLLILWGLQAYALATPAALASYDADGLLAAQWLVSALVVWQCGITVIAAWRPHDHQLPPWWGALAVGPVLIGWLLLSMGYGLKDTPMAMVVIEILVFARAFFDWRTVRPWILIGVLAVAAHELMRWQQLFPYAFMLSRPVFLGDGLSWWWDIWTRVVFNAAIWPFAGMLFFVFGSLRRQRVELHSLARTDMLTGLANRREFMARLSEEAHRHTRGGQPLSVVMIDIDHFKQINDTHGHPAGDHVLAQLGGLLRHSVRRGIDVAARLGGEEFALLLPDTDLPGAQSVAAKLAERLATLDIGWEGQRLRVTLSMGVTQVADSQGDQAMRRADDNLYTAKRKGRNQVVATMPGDLL
ncbi:MAG: GGDEF domain-containing protein [Rubrivivax sp.]|nr:MAG: GGDEF domain-containing protein [Rubrivivax sp.]